MPDTTVYFATNRAPDAAAPGGFGAGIVAAGRMTYAVAPVTGTDLTQENSGTIGAITGANPGLFADAVRAEIETTNHNLLVFIHGFDNSFPDAIKRAAFNRAWFASSPFSAADTTVLAFSWPSAGVVFSSLPGPPDHAYLDDAAMAAQSGPQAASFLRQALDIAGTVQARGRRAFLLAHSMGNHVLASAVPHLFDAGAPAARFDEVFLAAGDEFAETLATPGAGMYRLRDIARRITVYYSQRDIAMTLSMSVNKNRRLGYAGPQHQDNTTLYPVSQFRFADCTAVFDFPQLLPVDATHQYYRRSATVRDDIATLMDGAHGGGMIELSTPLA